MREGEILGYGGYNAGRDKLVWMAVLHKGDCCSKEHEPKVIVIYALMLFNGLIGG